MSGATDTEKLSGGGARGSVCGDMGEVLDTVEAVAAEDCVIGAVVVGTEAEDCWFCGVT